MLYVSVCLMCLRWIRAEIRGSNVQRFWVQIERSKHNKSSIGAEGNVVRKLKFPEH